MTTAAHPIGLRTSRGRLALLGGLLLAEGGLVAAFFDAGRLDVSRAWWVQILARAGIIMPLFIAVVTATLLVGGSRLWKDLEVSVSRAPSRRVWPFLLVHLSAFVAFFCLTAVVFDTQRDPAQSGWWAAAWTMSGVAALVAWTATALPWGALVVFARRAATVLLAGIGVGVVAWGAGQVTAGWVLLGRSTMWMVHLLLDQVMEDAVVVPEQLIVGTRSFQIEIAPNCSGYQGIGLISVFLVVYLWVFRRTLRFPQALLLLPVGTLIMWLANAVRIAGLVGIGDRFSPAVALGGFHANSGSLLLCGVALGLGWAAHRSPLFTITEALPTSEATRNPTAAHLAPLIAIIVTAMTTGVLAEDHFDLFYGLRVLVAGATLWAFRREYTTLRWSWSWTAVGIGMAVFVLWVALEPTPPEGAGEVVGRRLAALPATGAAAWLALRVLGAAVTVPLAEELAFRGYLTRRLIARDFEEVSPRRFTWLSFLGSSVLFGAMHDRLLAGTLAGMLYGGAVYRRGELADAVVAHATTNAILAAYVIATGRWYLW